ncbi:hypothetical protein M9Y10_038552 [Tritrichomonas musculus]|uniref:Uncharacterized protein n=1 Tax=Tritrichomonas musculus TaxID=1915356 RepID=A0ABR2K8P0_9EUKA
MQSSKYSIFYLGGNHAIPLKLENCIFKGKLENGAHYIDGDLTNKDSPKLFIQSCIFSDDKKYALSLEANDDFVSKRLNGHIIYHSKFEDGKSTKKNSNYIAIALSSLITIVVAFAIVIFIIERKKNLYSDDQDEFEMTSDSEMPSQISI